MHQFSVIFTYTYVAAVAILLIRVVVYELILKSDILISELFSLEM
jgi:hypothetical protein